MNQQDSMLAGSADAEPPTAPSSRLREGWLVVARIVWLVMAVSLAVNFLVSIPAYYTELLTICTNPQIAQCVTFQPTTATLEALAQLGISLHTYAALYVAVDVAVSLTYFVVGALIFWRRSTAWWGLFFSFVLILFGSFGVDSSLILDFVKVPANPPVALLLVMILLICLQWGLLGAFLLTFPTGRFAPGWTWILILFWEFQVVLFLISAIAVAPSLLFAGEFLLTWGSVATVQFYRYRRLYTPMQRQQTKWVVFAYMVGVVVNLVTNALGALVPRLGAPDSPYQLLVDFISVCLALLIPLSIGIAILRYQLWDIDVIINRTLVYASLSAILAAIYIGGILAIQTLAALLTRQSPQAQSPVAIVVSTLVIAALFQPLRHRLQQLIDRRFYRSKYNAEKTLSAFATTVQSEVELAALRQKLVEVIEETMQPSGVALWLRSAPPLSRSDASPPPNSTRGLFQP